MNFRYYKTQNLVITILLLSVPLGIISKLIELKLKQYPLLDEAYQFIGIFSTPALIMGFLVLINEYLWKWEINGKKPFSFIVDIPNLNGRYEGVLVSSYNNKKMLCTMEIKQNASGIKIYSYFSEYETGKYSSTSTSVSEDLNIEGNNTVILSYNFDNVSEPLLEVGNHYGTARLIYYFYDKKITGRYFNQKNNSGSIEVIFKDKNILGR